MKYVLSLLWLVMPFSSIAFAGTGQNLVESPAFNEDKLSQFVYSMLDNGTTGTTPPVTPGTDPANIVQIGESQSLTLIGFASTALLKEHIKDTPYDPSETMGKTMVALSVTINDGFVGCGCPKAFNEFSITYRVHSKNEGKSHVVPDLMITDHPQRQWAMAKKFGTVIALGKPGILDDGNGFYVYDDGGNLLLEARGGIRMPKRWIHNTLDLGLHSLGGYLEGIGTIPRRFYRIAGPSKDGYRAYLPKIDSIKFDESSAIGQTLNKIGFVPVLWQNSELKNGTAWIPPQPAGT